MGFSLEGCCEYPSWQCMKARVITVSLPPLFGSGEEKSPRLLCGIKQSTVHCHLLALRLLSVLSRLSLTM